MQACQYDKIELIYKDALKIHNETKEDLEKKKNVFRCSLKHSLLLLNIYNRHCYPGLALPTRQVEEVGSKVPRQ